MQNKQMQTNLADIVTKDFAVPEGHQPAQFVSELLELLGHPDPVVRDEQAYSILAVWLERGHLDNVLTELGEACATALSHPEILRRSFSTLILTECLQRGRVTGLVSKAQAAAWMQTWAAWYPRETDTCSYQEGVGWIHAVAHGADTAGAYALWLEDAAELQHLAEVLETRLRSLSEYLHQTEDDRMALALLGILSRPAFGPEELQAWSARYQTLYTGLAAGQLPPSAVLALRTLHSLHTLLQVGATIGGETLRPAHQAEAVAAVQAALRSFYAYHGTP